MARLSRPKFAAGHINAGEEKPRCYRGHKPSYVKTNTRHPTYAALIELGKVVKTIFLCNYLASEEMRREINSGLNVIVR